MGDETMNTNMITLECLMNPELYRKMVKKYHPDKLMNVSEDVIKMAKDKFQSVKNAYDRISKERGF